MKLLSTSERMAVCQAIATKLTVAYEISAQKANIRIDAGAGELKNLLGDFDIQTNAVEIGGVSFLVDGSAYETRLMPTLGNSKDFEKIYALLLPFKKYEVKHRVWQFPLSEVGGFFDAVFGKQSENLRTTVFENSSPTQIMHDLGYNLTCAYSNGEMMVVLA